jgi:arylsulfatase A-like enzyme/Tfp pilus assembly protein PilF
VKRRTIAVGVLILGALAAGWYWQTHLRGPKWNLLVVTFGTTRADHIGAYGHATARTPAVDGLAQQGVLFERVYATAPTTLPSHATMFTGLQPLEHGLVTNGKGRLPDELVTLAEILSVRGCRTGAFTGAFVLDSRFGLEQGFETYNDDLSGTPRPADWLQRQRPGDAVVDAALAWLNEHQAEQFHCWIHLHDPHLPHIAHPQEGIDAFADAPYDGEIAFADRQLARVLSFLKEQKLDENTLIVVAGDHGEGLAEHQEHGHGYLLHQSTLQVPLVIVRPGEGPRGVRISEPVSLVDLHPTLLDLLEISTPQPISGSSLARVWQGAAAEPRACLSMTAEPLFDNGWSPLHSLTTADWKYIRSPIAELYDLKADPGETTNLAQLQADRVAELESQLTAQEAKLRPHEAAVATLSAAEKPALERTASSDAKLPDVKEKLPLYNKLGEAVRQLDAGDAAGAEPILREVVAADPKYLRALVKLGICVCRLGRPEEAVQCFEQALAIDPDDVSALLNLADALSKLGRAPEAITRYQQAMKADRESPVAPMQLGLLYQSTGDLLNAEMLYAQAIQRDPTYDPVICAQGELALQQGDGPRAVERYLAALGVNPRSTTALVNLGIIAAQNEDLDSAEKYFRHALRVDPQDLQARQNLARIAMFRGRPLETVAGFEAILADTPDSLTTIVALGWMRAAFPATEVRDAQQALALGERAVALAGRESMEALQLLAAAQAEAGRFDEAVATQDEAIRAAEKIDGAPVEDAKQRRDLYAGRQPYRSEVILSPQGGPAPN